MPRQRRTSDKTPVQLTTIASFLLDRSGSMEGLQKAVVDGFNEWLSGLRAAQKENPNNTIMLCFQQFNTNMGQQLNLDRLYEFKPVLDVPDITPDQYQPRGSTPLLDAMGETIRFITGKLGGFTGKVAVLFMTMTDGQENASKTETNTSLKELVAQREKDGNWTFAYMGANQDSFAEVGKYGTVSTLSNTMNYAATPGSVREMLRSANVSTKAYMNVVYGASGTNDPLRQVNFFAQDPTSGKQVDLSGFVDQGVIPQGAFYDPYGSFGSPDKQKTVEDWSKLVKPDVPAKPARKARSPRLKAAKV